MAKSQRLKRKGRVSCSWKDVPVVARPRRCRSPPRRFPRRPPASPAGQAARRAAACAAARRRSGRTPRLPRRRRRAKPSRQPAQKAPEQACVGLMDGEEFCHFEPSPRSSIWALQDRSAPLSATPCPAFDPVLIAPVDSRPTYGGTGRHRDRHRPRHQLQLRVASSRTASPRSSPTSGASAPTPSVVSFLEDGTVLVGNAPNATSSPTPTTPCTPPSGSSAATTSPTR